MLLVILGAGASYDSVPITPSLVEDPDPGFRPPLANELVDNRKAFRRALLDLEAATPLAIRLQRRLNADPNGGSVERELAEYEKEAEGNRHFRRHLVAFQFYLQRILAECGERWHRGAAGQTNYVELLSRVEDWRVRRREKVLVVTFNYDTMIEHAARIALDAHWRLVDDYVRSESFQLFKLHGSVNWGNPISRGLAFDGTEEGARAAIIRNIDRVGLVRDFVLSAAPVTDEGRLLVPALAIRVERKSQFACPDTHVEIFKDTVSRIQRILVIGWRATERHFLELLEPLSRFAAPIQVVNGSKRDGMMATNMLESQGLRGKKVIFDGGFTDFLASENLEEFLVAPITR